MNEIIGVIGVGYVGLPLVRELSRKNEIIAYDVDQTKITKLKANKKYINVNFTFDEKELKKCKVIIVAVPTPLDEINNPDLTNVLDACKTIGRNLSKNTLIIFESSYMPGTTTDICVPTIEKESKKKYNVDFYVGYSPERINPGDEIHTLNTITKIVSADDEETLKRVISVYNLIEDIKLHPVMDMRVAELSKMVENTQRDINIAFVNEISKLCHKLNLNTKDVLEAAGTKWNFYKVFPGLVGGHCIGVDPYYLIDIAKRNNVSLDVAESARKANESMSNYIVENLVSLLPYDYNYQEVNVGILGFSYKSNSDDIRNTKVKDIYDLLIKKGFNVSVSDYLVDTKNTSLKLSKLINLDVLIIAVDHDMYKNYDLKDIMSYFKNNSRIKIIMDLKSIYYNVKFPKEVKYWNL